MKIYGLKVPKKYRYDFSQPRGILVKGEIKEIIDRREWNKIICVGDIVSFYCLKAKRKPDIIILDGKTLRKNIELRLDTKIIKRYKRLDIVNPPGVINVESFKEICETVKNDSKRIVFVNGEEDMLALPCMACAPIGSLVVYGIPDKGAALVNVSLYIKRDLQQRVLVLNPIIMNA
ncbi:MAG: GTP-dependent dephospho-CoA kinase family protein [Caldisphaeraceae archaeon]|nr:GTP-dependent dephospho-CoA kinase family protein [Caldisphaeraceae archaeon]